MAINLMNLLKDQMSDSLVNTIAGSIGENSSVAKSGINAILPTLLGSMANKASSTDGASSLLNMIKDGGYDGSMLGKLSNVFGGGAATDELKNSGASMLSSIMGNQQNSILDTIASVSGMGKSSSSSLMSMMAPMVMSMIGKQVMGNNLNASGLMNLMQGQKSHIASALPAGMGNVLGFANASREKVVAAATSTTTAKRRETTPTPQPETGGGLPWKMILGALALALLGYFGFKTMGGASDTMTDTTEAVSSTVGNATDAVSSTAGNAASAASGAVGNATDAVGNAATTAGTAAASAVTEIKDAAGLTMDASGNLVDKAGNIVRKAGTFTKDASGKIIDKVEGIASKTGDLAAFSMDDAGNLVDGSGKIVYKKGEFTEKEGVYYDKSGKKIGQFLKKVGAAIAGAANKTADAFKDTFGGMFKSADKGTSHTLQAMKWKDDTHKLTYYSQNELKGLVAALKANPDAKIEVQAYTADGGGKRANKELSKMRAQVVADMMVSFGVPKGQISSKGMSAKDGAAAAMDKIEIVVD